MHVTPRRTMYYEPVTALLVDTNVLVDVLQDGPQWANWSIGQMRAQAGIHQLAISRFRTYFPTLEVLAP